MNIKFLDLLGIHEQDIEVTESRIEDAFAELGLDVPDDLAERTVQLLSERTVTEDLGNQIIRCMLEAAAGALEDAVSPLKPEIEIYVNGADSRFAIVNESDKSIIRALNENPYLEIGFIEWLEGEFSDEDDLLEVVKNDDLCDALRSLRESGRYLTVYDESDFSDEEIEARETACLDDPDDPDKVFFVTCSGRVFVAE